MPKLLGWVHRRAVPDHGTHCHDDPASTSTANVAVQGPARRQLPRPAAKRVEAVHLLVRKRLLLEPAVGPRGQAVLPVGLRRLLFLADSPATNDDATAHARDNTRTNASAHVICTHTGAHTHATAADIYWGNECRPADDDDHDYDCDFIHWDHGH